MKLKELTGALVHNVTKTAVNFFHTDDDYDEREALIAALEETIEETVHEHRGDLGYAP